MKTYFFFIENFIKTIFFCQEKLFFSFSRENKKNVSSFSRENLFFGLMLFERFLIREPLPDKPLSEGFGQENIKLDMKENDRISPRLKP